jgi:hypothetical protein
MHHYVPGLFVTIGSDSPLQGIGTARQRKPDTISQDFLVHGKLTPAAIDIAPITLVRQNSLN